MADDVTFAGETALLNVFRDGAIVVLYSKASLLPQRLFMEGETVILESHSSGKTLRIRDGEVQGSGGRGALAQFKVWIRAPGVAALQNKDDWIAIRENKLTTGNGGLYTNLIVEEVDGFVVLESHVHKGQHVGIYPDGEVKPPNETGTGKHARFTPTLLD